MKESILKIIEDFQDDTHSVEFQLYPGCQIHIARCSSSFYQYLGEATITGKGKKETSYLWTGTSKKAIIKWLDNFDLWLSCVELELSQKLKPLLPQNGTTQMSKDIIEAVLWNAKDKGISPGGFVDNNEYMKEVCDMLGVSLEFGREMYKAGSFRLLLPLYPVDRQQPESLTLISNSGVNGGGGCLVCDGLLDNILGAKEST